MICKSGEAYICVADSYFGQHCSSWSAAGWNTGNDWGYKPPSALKKVDHNGKSLLTRMTLRMEKGCIPGKIPLILSIENPQKGDSGTYLISVYHSSMNAALDGFQLADMSTDSRWSELRPDEDVGNLINPLMQHITVYKAMTAISNPTFEDVMAIESGSSDNNLWLEWMRYTVEKHNRTNCYVCSNARPHLGTVPLNIPHDQDDCFLGLYNNVTSNNSLCEQWKREYPLMSKAVNPGNTITIYPGNYTCYTPLVPGTKNLGKMPSEYCSETRNTTTANHTRSLGDIYWLCGDMRIRNKLEASWRGECALVKIIMPIYMFSTSPKQPHTPITHRRKRATVPGGSLDPHVYIDNIGVPRGVPDKFKARDQVAAGFESLIPLVTINKNVDWINYIYYNQQRFVNYTRDALQGTAEQLDATSQMTFQNRMALDMMLAEKGGTCIYIDKVQGCCTYIPDSTGPNGKVTQAISKLKDLSEELKRNSGIDNPWDQYFGWFTNWKQALVQICTILLIIFVVFIITIFCILPCCKRITSKGIERMFYQSDTQTTAADEYTQYLTLYRSKQKQGDKAHDKHLYKNHII